MYQVELYLRVRRACKVDGMSIREASRVFGVHRKTVRKMLEHPVPPGYRIRRPRHRRKLERFTAIIDRILRDDLDLPRKQRHTAKRIHERLRDEHGFDGGYTTVKDYVRERRVRTREMYVPLSHAPGHAQCDFGQAKAVIAGVERTVHYFVLDLPHSDGCFIKAYPAETTEAFCDGHVSTFSFLGGVPMNIPGLRRGRLCTTTRSWPWPGSWETASVSVPACSRSSCRTTCSRTVSAVRARATTRVRWRDWWVMCAATSWRRRRRIRASMRSTAILRSGAWSGWADGCVGTTRR